MLWLRKLTCIATAVLFAASALAATQALYSAKNQLELLNADHWETGKTAGKEALILKRPGKQRPPVRRPSQYALWKGTQPISTFSIEAISLESTSVTNRDVCLIFGYQDETHFYYAHVSSNSDNKFHNIIMRVDGDSRTRINLEKDPEPRLTDGWHTLRIEHLSDGSIHLFVDNMDTPLMTASDTTYPVGRIGFGSFDDRAAFSSLSIE